MDHGYSLKLNVNEAPVRIVEAADVIAEGLAVEGHRFRHVFHVHNRVSIHRLQVRRCH